MMKYLILIILFAIGGCTTYPTVDMRSVDGTETSSISEKNLIDIFESIGFSYKNEVWRYKDADIYLSYILGHDEIEIRVISHNGEPSLTKSLAKELEGKINIKYPLLKFSYRYFEQRNPFG